LLGYWHLMAVCAACHWCLRVSDGSRFRQHRGPRVGGLRRARPALYVIRARRILHEPPGLRGSVL